MKIKPARRLEGEVIPVGDKSISHRAAIIAALARGSSRISGFSNSQDCASTLKCLRQIGISAIGDQNNLRIEGADLTGFKEPKKALDCGNSGTTMRILAGLLAGQSFCSELDGDQSLRSRPMRRIINPLELMGARIQSSDGRPPLRISPSERLRCTDYKLPVASAQVKSCVLLAGLQAEGRTSVIESSPTRDHTERLLRWFDIPVDERETQNGNEVSVRGEGHFVGRDIAIPGDISAAAFLIAAAALLEGSKLTIKRVGLNPSRTQFVSQLESLGASMTIAANGEISNEPVGSILVTGGLNSKGTVKISGTIVPQLIDELPLLAIVGTQLTGGIEIRDAGELRVKESDRIAATVKNLRAMKANVEEYSDGLFVSGPTALRGAVLDARGDHRIALAFAVAALIAEGESEIIGAECAAISFPGFFELLERLAIR